MGGLRLPGQYDSHDVRLVSKLEGHRDRLEVDEEDNAQSGTRHGKAILEHI